MDFKEVFYINDDGNKVYDTNMLPGKDPIRLFIEDQYCRISYDSLYNLEKAHYSDICIDDLDFHWYSSPYLGTQTELLLRDTEEKRELIEDREKLTVNSDEYNSVKQEMIEHNIYDSYLEG